MDFTESVLMRYDNPSNGMDRNLEIWGILGNPGTSLAEILCRGPRLDGSVMKMHSFRNKYEDLFLRPIRSIRHGYAPPYQCLVPGSHTEVANLRLCDTFHRRLRTQPKRASTWNSTRARRSHQCGRGQRQAAEYVRETGDVSSSIVLSSQLYMRSLAHP